MSNNAFLRSFSAREDGNVAIISAVALVGMIGTAGLAVEYGNALLTKGQAQRAIDIAVYSAAVEYGSSASTAKMEAVAASVLEANGISADRLILTLGQDTLRGTVVTTAPLALTRVIRDESGADVRVSATVLLGAGEPTCLAALDSDGDGIVLRGNAELQTLNCMAASGASVAASCGTQIITSQLTYNSDDLLDLCKSKANVVTVDGDPAPIERAPVVDPLANDPAITAASSLLASATNYGGPPSISGPDIDFINTGNNKKIQDILEDIEDISGCSGAHDDGQWTITCTGAAPHAFGEITVGGGASLRIINASGSSTAQFTFESFSHDGDNADFDAATFLIADGLEIGGGSEARFGAGSSFEIGAPSANGDAITVGGGGTLILGSATTEGTAFKVAGNITSAGGSCVLLGAASEHIINGSIEASGAGIFGVGAYAVTDYINFGTGGSVPCDGQNTGLRAEDVVFLIGGNNVPTNGSTCNRSSFCIGAGKDNSILIAPEDGVFAGLAVVGPLTQEASGGGTFAAGANDTTISGVLYFPQGPLTLSGGASIAAGAEGCLQIIAAEIEMSGGTSAISDCLANTGSTSVAIRLIQ